MAVVVAILVITGIGMSVLHYLREPYNPGFIKHTTVTNLHIIPGTIYLLLAPFQFVSFIRNKWMSAHRWIGRIISLLAIIVGLTSFFMAVVFPFSGLTESVSVTFFATIFLLAIVKGIWHIRARNVARHREWMTRAFALGLAIATSRIIFLPVFFGFADPSLAQIKTLFITCFILAFTSHLVIAELWLRVSGKQVNANIRN